MLALHAKAAILFERASSLQLQYNPSEYLRPILFRSYSRRCLLSVRKDMNLADATRFQQTFNNLNNAINNIAPILPSVTGPNLSRETIRRLLVVHTLCRVASILLHGTFEDQDRASNTQILTAAESVVMLLHSVNLRDFPFIDPIMGVSTHYHP